MKRQQRLSLLQRIARRKAQPGAASAVDPEDPSPESMTLELESATLELTGSALEQAYRDSMIENQVLAEANQRLHDRQVCRAEDTEESPAARELIQAQRNALAEHSRRTRELEYENTQLKREQNRLIEDNRQLSTSLAQHMHDIQPLLQKEELARRELADAKATLRDKSNELLRLTDKYYQLEARTGPPTAANSDF